MRISLLDFGIGNMHSLAKAFELHGADVEITPDVERALAADAIVLPGVGAFGAASSRLDGQRDMLHAALRSGRPCLGICLGLQLLCEGSAESPGAGIGLLPGSVRELDARLTPQMGWNSVRMVQADPLNEGLDNPVMYYANRYVVPAPATGLLGTTTYDGDTFPAVVRIANTWGVQFHPEKSGDAGLRLIGNFVAAARDLR